MVIAFIGVVVSLLFLVIFAYRGHSVVVVAPLAALIAALASGAPLLGTYTQVFMPALGNFVVKYFPLFLLGAIFGYLMTSTGLARYLARGITALFGPKRALLSTVIATALLTYGGVSAWVVAFTIVPIATALFQEADIPKRLMPAAIAFGTITFALASLPGSPQIHNAIPTSYFGTNVYAAPIFGVVAAAIMLVLGMAWLEFRVRALHRKGERFDPIDAEGNIIELPRDSGAAMGETEADIGGETFKAEGTVDTAVEPNVKIQGLLGLLPIAVVIITNFLMVYVVADLLDADYLAEEKYGATSIDGVIGVWSPVVALSVGVLVIVATNPRRFRESIADLSEGAKNAILPCFTTASEVGYGAVVASLAVFATVKNSMFGISDNALVISTVSTAVISGITGSSSGGLSITMETLGTQLAQLAAEQEISPELMHRVTAMASVSFDSFPHNGAILTMLIVCGMTHRLAYKDIFVVTVVVPLVTLVAMLGVNAVIPLA
ncbi:GntP family permease [Corynebacterium pilosum]|uniref:Transporter protein n=1 Tax=Corynebacterium pilosum TaxID=35756 RepID=A0A376CMS2_9CORY|nr:GntP family permease [Corynebacterium pilosum]STC69816.1 transporter protein [Corynebacterium pilosum]